VIEELATSRRPRRARGCSSATGLYFVITMNPDGRVAGTRANANGFNLNRDFITQTQPETAAVRDVIIDTQALVMLDLHGYVNGTLIEPTTPPHGRTTSTTCSSSTPTPTRCGWSARSWRWATPRKTTACSRRRSPSATGPEGWDDWPPIFTPQYAAFHGTVSHTIEIPLRVNNDDYNLPAAELRRRAAINTAVAAATVRASIWYVMNNRRELIADQIEIFRRGEAGEPQPDRDRDRARLRAGGRLHDDVPAGRTSSRSAGTSVPHRPRSGSWDFLAVNDVEVRRASAAFRFGGRTYPRGTYVVDMHQAKRGLANVILEAGGDVTERVDAMYDISAWSHRLLWGASVDVVESGTLRMTGRGSPVRSRRARCRVPAGG
jgi:hypothetical protein